LTYSDYYAFVGQGAASFNTSITIGNLVGSNAGIVGGTFRSLDGTNVPVIVDFDTDQAHISTLNFYGVNWVDITGSFDIGANSAFNVFSNQFIGCGQVDPVGACEIRNCLFINTVSTAAALLWNESIDIQACTFIANTLGAGIEMPSDAGDPYTYTSLLFSGNTNGDVLNSSGVGITVNKAGTPASDPSTYDAGGDAVTFQASTTITITVQDGNPSPIEAAQVAIYRTADRVQIMNEDTIANGTAVEAYTGATGGIEIRVRKSSTGATKYVPFSTLGTLAGEATYSLLVTLLEDLNA
jgi:hypothetical protein